MEEGYVYCMTNEHMPLFVKVGFTIRTPEERLAEANSETFSIPVWKCEFSCKVKSPHEVERLLHQILSDKRVHPKREFFRCAPDEVRPLFDLLRTQQEQAPAAIKSPGCREPKKCFRNGQMLKHIYKKNECRAIYKAENDVFVWNTTEYSSLSKLHIAHKQSVNPELNTFGNAWDTWECMNEDGDYISVKNLPELTS